MEENPAGAEGKEEGGEPSSVRMYPFFGLSLGAFFFFFFSGGRGEQEIMEPHCEGRASQGFAKECRSQTGLGLSPLKSCETSCRHDPVGSVFDRIDKLITHTPPINLRLRYCTLNIKDYKPKPPAIAKT